MRRSDREVSNTYEIEEIIRSCRVCRIAMNTVDGIYIIPMNFGYAYEGKSFVFYFHGACEGRKIDALKRFPYAAFEMDCQCSLSEGSSPCSYSFLYKSITGSGKVEFIKKIEDKKAALNIIMKHQTGKNFKFDEKIVSKTAVFRLVAEKISAKENK